VRKFTLLYILLILSALSLYPNQFEITASVDAVKLGLDDTLIYTIKIKGNNNPVKPNISIIKDFKTVQTQRGSEFSIINGVTSYYTNFTFYLSPKKTGILKIEPISYSYKGKVYTTRGFDIEVVKGSIKPANGNRRMGNRGLRSFFDNSLNDPFDNMLIRRRAPQRQTIDVFLKTDISKKIIKKGEQIIYTIYLYTLNRITNVSLITEQSFPGFFQEWKPLSNQIEGFKKEYDGKIYQVYEIRKVALFPTKIGTLTIPALKFAINVYDPYSFAFSNSRKIFRTTNEIKINSMKIKGQAGLPVGSYTIKLSVPKRQIDINDILTVKLKITGVGNIKTLPVPSFEPNPDFKIFEPVIKRETHFTKRGMEGIISSDITLNFKRKGTITLPALKLKIFDSIKNKIVILQTVPVNIKVSGIKEKSNGSIPVQHTIAQTQFDISYIREGVLKKKSINYYNLQWFYILLILPFIINIIIFLKRFVLDSYLNNSVSLKNKRFFNKIQKNLLAVKNYGDIHSIIEEYFEEKSNVGFSDLTNETIENYLTKMKICDSDIKLVLRIKTESESAKFSPLKKDSMKLGSDIKNLLKILKKIEGKG